MTAVTVMFKTSVSVIAPPLPVFPKSVVTTVSVAVPLKLAAGRKEEPFSAVLIAPTVPVMVTDDVSSPANEVPPKTLPKRNTPLVTLMVT